MWVDTICRRLRLVRLVEPCVLLEVVQPLVGLEVEDHLHLLAAHALHGWFAGGKLFKMYIRLILQTHRETASCQSCVRVVRRPIRRMRNAQVKRRRLLTIESEQNSNSKHNCCKLFPCNYVFFLKKSVFPISLCRTPALSTVYIRSTLAGVFVPIFFVGDLSVCCSGSPEVCRVL